MPTNTKSIEVSDEVAAIIRAMLDKREADLKREAAEAAMQRARNIAAMAMREAIDASDMFHAFECDRSNARFAARCMVDRGATSPTPQRGPDRRRAPLLRLASRAAVGPR